MACARSGGKGAAALDAIILTSGTLPAEADCMDPRPSCARVGLLVADDCVAAAEGEASSDLD